MTQLQSRPSTSKTRTDIERPLALPKYDTFKITFYLAEGWRTSERIERLWNNLMALDCCLEEVYLQAGTGTAEWIGDNPSFLEKVPGIVALTWTIKPKVELAKFDVLSPKGEIKALDEDRRRDKKRRAA